MEICENRWGIGRPKKPRREAGAAVPKLAPPPPVPTLDAEDEFTAFSSAPAAPLEEGWADFADAFPEAG